MVANGTLIVESTSAGRALGRLQGNTLAANVPA